MKLAVLCALAAVAMSAPMPQGRPFPPRMTESFMKYLGRYQKIFANPANHKALQDMFSSPSMQRMIFSLLHKQPPFAFPGNLRTNWRDQEMSLDEFMAWHPSLERLFSRFGAKPVLLEEWRVADTDGKRTITPIKLWTMLRDANTNKFFTSFLSLLYSEWQKTYNGRQGRRGFFNDFKKAGFEQAFDGMWGRIAQMPEIPDRVIKQMSEEVARTQGPEAAQKLMEDLGMGTSADEGAEAKESISVLPEGSEGSVDLPVEKTPGEMAGQGKPFIAANEQVMAMSGEKMLASDMVEAGMEALPGMPLNATMPNGQQVEMTTAPITEADDGAQPQAKIQSTSGQEMTMPVTEMATDGQTSTTKILTDEGTQVAITAPMPDKIDTAAGDTLDGASQATSAQLTDEKSGTTATGMLTPTADPEINDEVCDSKEDCQAVTFATEGMEVTLPMAVLPDVASDMMPGEESANLEVEVTNPATKQSTVLEDAVATQNPATGDVTITAVSPDHKTMLKMEIPAKKLANKEGLEEGEGNVEIDGVSGNVLATGKIESAEFAQDPTTGEEELVAKANIGGTDSVITMKGDLDSLKPEGNVSKITLTMDGKKVKLVKVDESEDTVTGMTPDGAMQVTVPKENAATTEDGNPATTTDVIEMETLDEGAEEIPIAVVNKDGQGNEELVGRTKDGKIVDVQVEEESKE